MSTARSPAIWQAASWALSVLVAMFGTHLATKATATPTTPITPTTPVVVSVVPEPSSVDRLVAAAKDRPTIIDEFEAGSRKVASEAREKLAKK